VTAAEVFPCASLAVQVTVVWPGRKRLPDAGDAHGNTSAAVTFRVYVRDAAAQSRDLSDLIAGYGLDQGFANELQNRLAAVENKLDRPNDACHALDGILEKAAIEAGKSNPRLTVPQAQEIVAAGHRIEAALGC
jgi:hypothetical protein